MSNSQVFDIQQAIADAKRVITDPFGFYKELSLEGGLTNPMLFVVCMAVVMAAISVVFSFVGLGMSAGIGAAIVGIIVLPIAAIIGSFIAAGIMYIIWKLLGSDKNFEAAYRCVAYSFAIAPVVAVLSVVPYLGTIVRALWGGFILYAASTNAMAVKEQTAKIVIGILVALSVIVGVSGESKARKMQAWGEKYADSVRQSYSEDEIAERLENMTAEDAGEMLGDFLKGIEKAAKEAEEAEKTAEAD